MTATQAAILTFLAGAVFGYWLARRDMLREIRRDLPEFLRWWRGR